MKSFYKNCREFIPARLRTHFEEKERLDDFAYAMGQMLKVSVQQSRVLAREGAAQRARVNKLPLSKNPSRALDTLRGMSIPLDVPGAVRQLETHDNAYLLALPFTVSALSLVAHLVRDSRRRFCVIDTRYTRFYFHPFLSASETSGRVELLSPAAMLTHYRARSESRTPGGEARAATDDAVTYVTFPDVQATSLDTARRVPFMGEVYQFSTLDPLLFFRGLAPLYTFDVMEFAATSRVSLIAYPPPAARVVSESDIDALLAWLAGRMEQVFRRVPSDVLSWPDTHLLAYSTKATAAVMKLKMVEGYVRAWKVADPNFKEETFARSIAELRKEQGTIEKERLVAIAGQG